MDANSDIQVSENTTRKDRAEVPTLCTEVSVNFYGYIGGIIQANISFKAFLRKCRINPSY